VLSGGDTSGEIEVESETGSRGEEGEGGDGGGESGGEAGGEKVANFMVVASLSKPPINFSNRPNLFSVYRYMKKFIVPREFKTASE